MKQKTFFLFSFFCLLAGGLIAQHSDAEAVLKRDTILIGEQTEIKINLHYREGSKKSVVSWPELKDTLTYGVEILRQDSIKTRLADRVSVLYEQTSTLTITSFDEGIYEIPPIQFIVDNDTVQSLPVTLFVKTVPVDTTKPIKDIKGIYNVPGPPKPKDDSAFSWWWIAIGIIVLAGIIVLIVWLTRKKAVPVLPETPGRISLPHEKFLEELAELERKQQWLNGELKAYHISLTDIMRRWLAERYRIHAMEMTTFEMVRALKKQQVAPGSVMQMERILRTADMVKFAKGIPDREENETVMKLAISFIQNTAVYPQIIPTNPYPQA